MGTPSTSAGSPPQRLFVVALGTAELTRVTSEGDEVLLDALRQGDFLGGVPAFGQERYAEIAWPLSDCGRLSLDAAALDWVLDREALAGRGHRSRPRW